MDASSRWTVWNQGKGRYVIRPIGMLEGGITWLQMRNSKPSFGQPFKCATSVRVRTDRLPKLAKFLGSELFFPLAVPSRRLAVSFIIPCVSSGKDIRPAARCRRRLNFFILTSYLDDVHYRVFLASLAVVPVKNTVTQRKYRRQVAYEVVVSGNLLIL